MLSLSAVAHSPSNCSGWTSVHWTLSYCLHIAFIWCVAFGGMVYHGIIWFSIAWHISVLWHILVHCDGLVYWDSVWCCGDPRLGTSYVSWLGPTSSCPLTDIYVIYLFDLSVFHSFRFTFTLIQFDKPDFDTKYKWRKSINSLNQQQPHIWAKIKVIECRSSQIWTFWGLKNTARTNTPMPNARKVPKRIHIVTSQSMCNTHCVRS